MIERDFASLCRTAVHRSPETGRLSRLNGWIKGKAKGTPPVLLALLWLASVLMSYRMGQNAGRAKEIAGATLKQVAQAYYEQGLAEGYFNGLSKQNNILKFLPE